jgi:hypothetical protein
VIAVSAPFDYSADLAKVRTRCRQIFNQLAKKKPQRRGAGSALGLSFQFFVRCTRRAKAVRSRPRCQPYSTSPSSLRVLAAGVRCRWSAPCEACGSFPRCGFSCAPRVARLRPGSSSASAGTRTSARHRALLTTRSAPERLTAPGGHLAAFTEVPVAASVGLGSLATVPLHPRWWTCELTSTRRSAKRRQGANLARVMRPALLMVPAIRGIGVA